MKHLSCFIMISVALIMSGCATQTSSNATDNIENNKELITTAIQEQKNISSSKVVVHSNPGVYIAGKPFELTENDNLPSFFNRNLIINQPSELPYSALLFDLSKTTGIDIQIAPNAITYLSANIESNDSKGNDDSTGQSQGEAIKTSGEPLFSFHFTGTLEEALDKLTNRVGLFWEYDGRQVVVFRTKTDTYILDALPSQTSFSATSSSTAGSSGEAGSSASSATSSQSTNTSTETGNIWSTIDKTLQQFMSPHGLISSNPSLGSITLTDTPIVHYHVKKYIEDYNRLLGKRIAVHTAIYQVSINNSDSQGIDWNAVFASQSSGTNLSYSTLSQGFGLLEGAGTGAFSAVKETGRWTGSQLLLQSLNKIGKASLNTSSTSITTNGQPVPLSNLNNIHYVSEQKVNTDDENGNITVEVSTDVITQGVAMTVLPKLMHNNDVLIQVAIDMSVLNALIEFPTGDGGIIQLPNASNQSFLQNIPMRQGQTLMISGFERESSQTNSNSIFKDIWALGGNKNDSVEKTMTVIFITPYVLAR